MNKQHRYARILLILLLLILSTMVLSACGTDQGTPTATQASAASSDAPDPGATSAPADDGSESTGQDIADAVASRTPIATPAPSLIDQKIDDVTNALGLEGATFLGLTVPDWINLGISLLIIFLGYTLGDKLVISFMRWVISRTSADPDDAVLVKIKDELKWIVVVFATRYAILRLTFIGDPLRTAADDLLFILEIAIFAIIGIRLVDYAFETYKETIESKSDLARLEPILRIAERLIDFVIAVMALSVGLSHFGLSINVLSALILFFGAIVVLGAQDMISDFISGFIILTDQPFRVEDRIYVKDLGTWGDVLEIDTRTTRIRMNDNREVIIPNSEIVNSQIVNFTTLGPSYRLQTEIGIAYGTDVAKVRMVVEDTVRAIDGVVQEKPVDVLFLEFGDTTRSMRVRWWIENYKDKNRMLDQVHAALEIALTEADIDMPFNTFDLNVKMKNDPLDPETPADQS